MKNKKSIKVIGIRHGEKMFETLLTNEECAHALDLGSFYRVPCDKRGLNYDKYFTKGDAKRNTISEFNNYLTNTIKTRTTYFHRFNYITVLITTIKFT